MKFALGAISTIWLIFAVALLSQVVSTSSNTTQTPSTQHAKDDTDDAPDLDKAETKDLKKLEIIKQIRRVNNDGSYTVGYEADDGTFKIESRDVLGNVKGTYGYVDENGEIKRVSYTANNATNGLKSTLAPSTTVEDVVHIPRQNRTNFPSSTTRRPVSLAYLTSTASPARTNTAQSIPKRRILLSSANRAAHKNLYSSNLRKNDATTTSTTKKLDPTATLVFATSVPLQRTTKVTSTTPSTIPSSTILTTSSGTEKSTKVEISGRISRVLNMNKDRITTTEKPVVESVDEGESQTERKPLRGNFLRRQLPDEAQEQFEAQQQVVYSSQASAEDNGHAFGGVSGTLRPIFSTTSSPRIPALVLAARNRAAILKNAQHSSTTEKIYSKPPRRKTERRGEEDDPNTEPSSENSFLTQSPIPVQIPANRDPSQSENEQRIYRRPPGYQPRTRQYRVPVPVPSQAVNAEYDGEQQQQQYHRETTDPNEIGNGAAATAEQYLNGEVNGPGYVPRFPRPYQPQADPQQQSQQAQQSYPLPLPYPPYNRPLPNLYNNHYNNLDRPLTARDFERLLNMLVYRYQQFQRNSYYPGALMNPYMFGGGGYGPPPYQAPYSPFGYQQIPRPPVYHQYDPRYGGYRPSPLSQPPLYPYTEQENMYQAQNPIPDQQQQQVPYTGHRLSPRRKPYGPQYFGPQQAMYSDRPEYEGDESQQSLQQASSDYLPSDVREELLYRMLMLAIQPNSMTNVAPIPEASTMQEYVKATESSTSTAAEPTKASKKPVRSVQILGEE